MLILAGVTITTVLGDDGIIAKAKEAADKTKEAEEQIQSELGRLPGDIESWVNGGSSGSDTGGGTTPTPEGPTPETPTPPTTIQDAVKDSTTFNNTTKLKDENNEEVYIPGGFTIVTNKMDETVEYETDKEYPTVKSGIVITDHVTTEDGKLKSDGNEFVWVPVPNPEDMYGEDSNVNNVDENGDRYYLGKLYNFGTANAPKEKPEACNWTEVEGKIKWSDNADYREPDILTDEYDGDASPNGITGLKDTIGITVTDEEKTANGNDETKAILAKWKKQLQEEFKDMCNSVAKYKGFYIGRYETSLSGGKSESKKGATSLYNNSYANNWWGQYNYNKLYAPKGDDKSVVSSTIWGSQYDAMMKWMKGNGIEVTSDTPTDITKTQRSYNSDSSKKTGASGSNDKLCNIYDLLGNSYEWTMEARNTYNRVYRGGDYYDSNSPSNRKHDLPLSSNDEYSARLSLYVKL